MKNPLRGPSENNVNDVNPQDAQTVNANVIKVN